MVKYLIIKSNTFLKTTQNMSFVLQRTPTLSSPTKLSMCPCPLLVLMGMPMKISLGLKYFSFLSGLQIPINQTKLNESKRKEMKKCDNNGDTRTDKGVTA